MADKRHKGFETIETDYKQINKQIKEHRKKIFRRIVEIAILVILLLLIGKLVYSIRTYDDYEIKNTIRRDSTRVT